MVQIVCPVRVMLSTEITALIARFGEARGKFIGVFAIDALAEAHFLPNTFAIFNTGDHTRLDNLTIM